MLEPVGFTQVMQLHIIYTGKSSYLSSPEQSFYICGKHCKNLHDNKKNWKWNFILVLDLYVVESLVQDNLLHTFFLSEIINAPKKSQCSYNAHDCISKFKSTGYWCSSKLVHDIIMVQSQQVSTLKLID